jgi:hypothetical protein
MVPAITILLYSFLALYSCPPQGMDAASIADLPTVLVCEGSMAYAYHNQPTCKGLGQCEHGIIEIPEDSAKVYRQPCKICYTHE